MTDVQQDRETDAFERLLEQLRSTRSFDFTGYKRSSLMRRTRKRMGELGIDSFEDYAQRLDGDGDEFDALFNTILINVTSFFRDPLTWKVLEETVVPDLIARSTANGSMPETIRVWSAGCATGEEAFSIAMLFAERLGADQLSSRVKIYATDVDEHALLAARQAAYPAKEGDAVPEEFRKCYFERSGGRLTLVPELRRTVIFGRHDLVRDPPISRVGLLLCRNTLMYFNAALQRSVLDSFHFALRTGGYLCLGKSEMMVSRSGRFQAIDLKRRVFTPVLDGAEYYPRRSMTRDGPREASSVSASVTAALKTRAFEANDIPQIVLDQERHLILANRRARDLFGLAPEDIGKPVQDLELSYRPIELRSQIDKVESGDSPIVTRSARWERDGETSFWDITVALLSGRDTQVGFMAAFVDVTAHHGMEDELQRLRGEVQSAYGELQSTVEELETTNEELQSTNEELETTNEELQSTNEELETMNEELQSTNEELETMNDELRQRSTELNEVNFFFESVLASLQAGVVVTDTHLRIQVWNHQAEQLWGLRSDEVRGQDLLSLDIGLPVADLREPAQAIVGGRSKRESVTLEATNRTGRKVTCDVSIMPLAQGTKSQGLIILMNANDHQAGS